MGARCARLALRWRRPAGGRLCAGVSRWVWEGGWWVGWEEACLGWCALGCLVLGVSGVTDGIT